MAMYGTPSRLRYLNTLWTAYSHISERSMNTGDVEKQAVYAVKAPQSQDSSARDPKSLHPNPDFKKKEQPPPSSECQSSESFFSSLVSRFQSTDSGDGTVLLVSHGSHSCVCLPLLTKLSSNSRLSRLHNASWVCQHYFRQHRCPLQMNKSK